MQSYTLIRSKRRTLALTLGSSGELIVRAPKLLPLSVIESFICTKQSWILKHQERIVKKGIRKIQYTPLQIREMKQVLLSHLRKRISEIWSGKGLPQITGIKVTKSERRWGSCSARNSLCFSYRLASFLESHPEFIDAIIVHEIAHLREKHHQKKFWQLVYSMMPEYEGIMKQMNA